MLDHPQSSRSSAPEGGAPAGRSNRDAFWMPFTPGRLFRRKPRMLVGASGMHYTAEDGRSVLDGVSGLWCVNAGHGRQRITDAVAQQLAKLDFAPCFQFGHPLAFEAANRLAALMPGDIDHIFFTNSGSESVDTALKIALAYHRARGDAGRVRLIGRERGYHGVGFGGISVGGIAGNRRAFGPGLPAVDHLPHTHDLGRAFTRGQPQTGAELADALERIVTLHDASTVAAVIVEPLAGSTGVLPPPLGYLERLRKICDAHGILLIFDEVITGFGRLGHAFAAERYRVIPDILACAKGLTNGTFPMGAVGVSAAVHEAFMHGPENVIEFAHGYTYSAHPAACAAAIATLDTYADEKLFSRAAALAPQFEEAVHRLRGSPHVIDVRNDGLVAGVELQPRPGAPATRAFEVFTRCFEAGVMLRYTGETIAISPPLIVEPDQIDLIVRTLAGVLDAVD